MTTLTQPETWRQEDGIEILVTAHRVEVWRVARTGHLVLMANYPGGPKHGDVGRRWAQWRLEQPLLGPDLQVRCYLPTALDLQAFQAARGLDSLAEVAPEHFALDPEAEWFDEDFAGGYLEGEYTVAS